MVQSLVMIRKTLGKNRPCVLIGKSFTAISLLTVPPSRHRVFDIVFPVPDFIEVNPKQRNQTNNLTLVSASNVLGVTTGDLILYSAEVGEWWRGRHIAEGAFIG